MAHILVTGGAGYIGSHVCLDLLENGHQVSVVDNLANSKRAALKRVETLTGKHVAFHHVDIRDEAGLREKLSGQAFDGIIHMAGLKAVGESVAEPLAYYDANVAGTTTLMRVAEDLDVKTIVFSSSATVYGGDALCPIDETAPTGPINPYGRTKFFIEHILNDAAAADRGWRVVNLRYFNPVGAHPSGQIGEDPLGRPNNLFPIVAQVAVGRLDKVNVFGNDYDTPDGTGVRDYIHVTDLASAHVKAVTFALSQDANTSININLGTGQGYSVLDVIKGWKEAADKDIPYTLSPRRAGDAATCYANPATAARLLGWQATLGLADMCRDHWNFQRRNPQGYPEE
ncbi:MAG: UDP-glucose 4-epimerase GalE [Pseudomonadota bacterium]